MALAGEIDVPTFDGTLAIEVSAGASIVFVGANGAGKTRLGVLLDTNLSQTGADVHRIAAHRSLSLNPAVFPPSYEVATARHFMAMKRELIRTRIYLGISRSQRRA